MMEYAMAKAKPGIKRLIMSDDMTIYNALAQKEKLLQALQAWQELEIDLSKVGEIDTAGFQVLLLVKRESVNANKSLRLSAMSNAVNDLFSLFNATGYFADQAGLNNQVIQG
jgi:anti-sigma B factor antagonist